MMMTFQKRTKMWPKTFYFCTLPNILAHKLRNDHAGTIHKYKYFNINRTIRNILLFEIRSCANFYAMPPKKQSRIFYISCYLCCVRCLCVSALTFSKLKMQSKAPKKNTHNDCTTTTEKIFSLWNHNYDKKKASGCSKFWTQTIHC